MQLYRAGRIEQTVAVTDYVTAFHLTSRLSMTRSHVLLTSDVTNLFKIRIRRMRISTSKIRIRRMRISLDKGLFYHSDCNTLIYVN